MKVFVFCAFHNPPETINGVENPEKPKIIVQPTTVLAKDEKQAGMLAGRALPEQYLDRLDQVEMVVRPF